MTFRRKLSESWRIACREQNGKMRRPLEVKSVRHIGNAGMDRGKMVLLLVAAFQMCTILYLVLGGETNNGMTASNTNGVPIQVRETDSNDLLDAEDSIVTMEQQEQTMRDKGIVGTFNNYPITIESFTNEDTTGIDHNRHGQQNDNKEVSSFASTVQCVGDNFDADDTAWMYRSCDFHNLCFDLVEHDFVFVTSPRDQALQQSIHSYNDSAEQARRGLSRKNEETLQFLTQMDYKVAGHKAAIESSMERLQDAKDPISISVSTSSPNKYVSLGGLNPNWTPDPAKGYPILKWFPREISSQEMMETSDGYYYLLPSNAVLVPFHSFGAINVGHLMWDDFLPLYSLLSIFGYTRSENGEPANNKSVVMPILIRYGIIHGQSEGLWASCDATDKNRQRCETLWSKFIMAMGVPSWDRMTTPTNVQLKLLGGRNANGSTTKRARYVCARHGVAGMGMLTDHGLKKHGWETPDYRTMHNLGRGPSLYKFRSFLMTNMGYTSRQIHHNVLEAKASTASTTSTNNNIDVASPPSLPIKIVVSRFSSRGKIRNISFQPEVDALLEAFCDDDHNGNDGDGDETVLIQPKIFTYMNATEQVDVVMDASIMVTVAGGGAVTAMFLPRGASLIVYYDEENIDPPAKNADGNAAQDSVDSAEEADPNPNNRPVISGHLDWDYLNNLGYLRVHWLPLRSLRQGAGDTSILVDLVKSEIEFIRLRLQA
jgi:hypothetical protein